MLWYKGYNGSVWTRSSYPVCVVYYDWQSASFSVAATSTNARWPWRSRQSMRLLISWSWVRAPCGRSLFFNLTKNVCFQAQAGAYFTSFFHSCEIVDSTKFEIEIFTGSVHPMNYITKIVLSFRFPVKFYVYRIQRCEKRCRITTKQYKIVYFKLDGCLLYRSCHYQNITDQL